MHGLAGRSTITCCSSAGWVGFANRVLGDNMCEAVIDGGPAEPNADYFTRAEAAFTAAIAVQTGNLETAAYAGRAQVRVHLGKCRRRWMLRECRLIRLHPAVLQCWR